VPWSTASGDWRSCRSPSVFCGRCTPSSGRRCDASRRAGKLFGLRETYRERFQREGARGNLLAAINHLFANPVTSIRKLAEVLGVSFEAARRMVGSLEERGVLEEITGRRRNRVYAASEIVELLQDPLENE
jgi:hypothetical protein